MPDTIQPNKGPLLQFELLLQVKMVVDSIDVSQWDSLTIEQKHGIGLIGRWAIEKLLQALLIAQGLTVPNTYSLVDLYHASRLKLIKEEEYSLESVDQHVRATELNDESIEYYYQMAYELAKGMAETLNTTLGILSGRKSISAKKSECSEETI